MHRQCKIKLVVKGKNKICIDRNNFTLSSNHNHVFRHITPLNPTLISLYDMKDWSILIGCQCKVNLHLQYPLNSKIIDAWRTRYLMCFFFLRSNNLSNRFTNYISAKNWEIQNLTLITLNYIFNNYQTSNFWFLC
jgi:hypothetical protein